MTNKNLIPVELPGDATLALHAVPKQQLDVANTQLAQQAAQLAALLQADNGYFVLSGALIAPSGVNAGSNATQLERPSGVDFITNTEQVLALQSNQQGLWAGANTTVAAGSNGVHTNTYAGSGTLNVADASNFGTTGTVMVAHVSPTVVSVITYTGKSATTLTGCTLVNGVDLTLATGDTVYNSNADITNPRWAIIEVDSSRNTQANLGTAAASPTFPALTAARVPHAFLYIPANATAIDALLTTPNGNAKLIDARIVRALHPARSVLTDTSANVYSPGASTTITSIFAGATAKSVPANSLSVGDTFVIEGSLQTTNNIATSKIQLQVGFGGAAALTVTSITTFATSAFARSHTFRTVVVVRSIGGSGTYASSSRASFGDVAATTATEVDVLDYVVTGAAVDTTASVPIDVKVRFVTASNGASFTLGVFSVLKFPA